MSQDKNPSEASRFGLSDTYWKGLSEKSRQMMRVVRPLPHGQSATVHLFHLERYLEEQEGAARQMGGTFDLCPDFQRGHVWRQDQKERYVENLLRGVAPREIRFNSPSYGNGRPGGDIHPYDFVCVDGLQRITATRQFLAGDFPVFGDVFATDLAGTPFDPFRITMYLTVTVYSLNRRADLLQMYLDINNGGAAHTESEIERVKSLLEKAR